MTLKLAHISDLHLCRRNRPANIAMSERLLFEAQRAGVDHLLISGDISHDADADDWMTFREQLQQYGFLDPAKASIVIGNHDIFGGVHLATDIITYPQRCRETPYERKVSLFADIFSELFEGTERISRDAVFPYAKDLGEAVVFGINTNMAYSPWSNPMASNGSLQKEEWRDLKTLLRDDRFHDKPRIMLCHHHFGHKHRRKETNGFLLWKLIERYTIRLHRQRKLTRLLARHNIKAVFHGHVHYNHYYNHKNILFVNGGGSVESDIPGENGNLNLIEFDRDRIEIEIRRINGEKKNEHRPVLLYRELKPGFAG